MGSEEKDWYVPNGNLLTLVMRISVSFVRIFEHYLFHDRDVDNNLLFNTAYGVFADGKACVYAIEHAGLLHKIFDIATAWYTDKHEENMLQIPPEPVERLNLDKHKHAFRNKKGLTIFGHIRMLFRQEEVQKLIVSRPDLFHRAVEFFNLFVGLQPQKRELEEHVEYEIDWPRTFQGLGELAKSCRELGEAFRIAKPEQIFAGLGFVANRMFGDMMLVTTILDPERFSRPVEYQVENILVRGASFSLIHNYMPLIDAFSFHHYLHLLFAEIVKALPVAVPWTDGKYNGLNLSQVIDKYVFGSPSNEDADRMKFLILEWPLQSESPSPVGAVADDSACRVVSDTDRYVEEERSINAWTVASLPRDQCTGSDDRPGLLPLAVLLGSFGSTEIHDRRH